jgi:hypothetical protein
MEILIKTGVVVIIGLIFWAAHLTIRSRRYFTIKLFNGEPRVVGGKATAPVLELIRDVAAHNGIMKGTISGVEAPLGVRLEFSRSIPEPARQQLRNGWGILRWKPSSNPARKQ